MPDYTTVVAVDAYHLRQLAMTWPTWKRHKPSLLRHPMLAIRDHEQVSEEAVRAVVDHPDLKVVPWPPPGVKYHVGLDRWTNQQRVKMLSGFVHEAALVRTPYWLKIDTDTVATRMDDWIDETWFEGNPAIVAHRWGLTRPPEQMLVLDQWVAMCMGNPFVAQIGSHPPLNLRLEPGADKITHPRIISWCGFFSKELTVLCSVASSDTRGKGKLPVPSQDGLMWYAATRMGMGIKRVLMKSRGWEHWHTDSNIRAAVERAMG